MSFNYGDKQANGQYQNYPICTDGDYVVPVRNSYIHSTCGTTTNCSDGIAKTYATNPSYYTATFCIGCRDHYPVSEFKWIPDGIVLGQLGGVAGQDLRVERPKYLG